MCHLVKYVPLFSWNYLLINLPLEKTFMSQVYILVWSWYSLDFYYYYLVDYSFHKVKLKYAGVYINKRNAYGSIIEMDLQCNNAKWN